MIEKVQLDEVLSQLEPIANVSKLLGIDSSKKVGTVSLRDVIDNLAQDMNGRDLNSINTFTIGMAGDGVAVTNDPFSTSSARIFIHFELMYNFAFQIVVKRTGGARVRMRTTPTSWQTWNELT